MRIMVTGARGQLGSDVMACLRRRGIDCAGVDREDFDLTDAAAVKAAVDEIRPDAIIHCAAYTAVDRAESEPEVCMRVNGLGTKNLASAALAVDAVMMYISTDYVLAGEGEEPQGVDAPIGPRNVYGLSKLQGEQAVREMLERSFIVRSEWIYGAQGSNFVQAILKRSRHDRELDVVDDQVGSPTYSADLAEALCDLILTDHWGTVHITSEGTCSWADFAEEILRQTGSRSRVRRVSSAHFRSAARRPLNSRLDKTSMDEAGLRRLPPWPDALRRYLIAMGIHTVG